MSKRFMTPIEREKRIKFVEEIKNEKKKLAIIEQFVKDLEENVHTVIESLGDLSGNKLYLPRSQFEEVDFITDDEKYYDIFDRLWESVKTRARDDGWCISFDWNDIDYHHDPSLTIKSYITS